MPAGKVLLRGLFRACLVGRAYQATWTLVLAVYEHSRTHRGAWRQTMRDVSIKCQWKNGMHNGGFEMLG
jgi:hypothetical protein